jgi:DNA helicase-2/ATP-dependent DNA helicase PcrA
MKEIQLNQQQQEAISHRDGPMIVLSVAGSGKTMVLTERIIHLIENGIVVNFEEERRLMYVAMNRAKERLFITYRRRQTGQAITMPSRFLKELSDERKRSELNPNEAK